MRLSRFDLRLTRFNARFCASTGTLTRQSPAGRRGRRGMDLLRQGGPPLPRPRTRKMSPPWSVAVRRNLLMTRASLAKPLRCTSGRLMFLCDYPNDLQSDCLSACQKDVPVWTAGTVTLMTSAGILWRDCRSLTKVSIDAFAWEQTNAPVHRDRFRTNVLHSTIQQLRSAGLVCLLKLFAE